MIQFNHFIQRTPLIQNGYYNFQFWFWKKNENEKQNIEDEKNEKWKMKNENEKHNIKDEKMKNG